MARIVFARYFDEFPNLKIITHHMGAMIPYCEGRVGPGWDQLGSRTSDEDYTVLLKQLEFFGADNVLFASDSPFDPEKGPGYIRETIKIIEELPISDEDRNKIFEGNARRLLKI
jgi:aminocarboxymuconate-semialdehyde decarboxylase